MRHPLTMLVAAGCVCVGGTTAIGQNLAVQQPVFNVTSVGTTISVPDRGGAWLGGVGRVAASRSRGGPFRSGTSFGVERQASGLAAHVWIHDLAAMDRAVLNAASAKTPAGPTLPPGAEHALHGLLTRDHQRSAATADHSPRLPVGGRETVAEKADRYYRLGLRAERRGSPTVARLHFQTAARHGSTAARSKLAVPPRPPAETVAQQRNP